MTPNQEIALERIIPALSGADADFVPVLRRALDTGDAQIWPSASATVLTMVKDFPAEARRVLFVLPIGDEAEVLALAPGLQAWALMAGCTEQQPWELPRAAPVITLLAPAQAARAWPEVEAWIASALETTYTPITLDDVREATASGGMGLWLISEADAPVAVAVTLLRETDAGLKLSLGPVAGEGAQRWIEALDAALTSFARLHGCVSIISEGGRRGWSRALRGLGWSEGPTVYSKDLKEAKR